MPVRRLASLLLVVGCACLTACGDATPPTAAVPPVALDHSAAMPDKAEFARLAETDPVAALAVSVRRYRQDVKGYRATFHKQERMGGTLYPPEVVAVAFREEPFSVSMKWKEGKRGVSDATLYVRGENGGQMQARVLFGKVISVDPRGSQARGSSRFGIEGFGVGGATEKTYRAWGAAKDAGHLSVKFEGTRAVDEAGGRVCHVLTRECTDDEFDPFVADEQPPAVTDKTRPDSFRTATIYLDADTYFQLGSVVRRHDGEPVGSYVFRDIELNPTFADDEFTTAGLKR